METNLILYADANYTGNSYEIAIGKDPQKYTCKDLCSKLQIPITDASNVHTPKSVKVPQNCIVTLYDNAGGYPKFFADDEPEVDDKFNSVKSELWVKSVSHEDYLAWKRILRIVTDKDAQTLFDTNLRSAHD